MGALGIIIAAMLKLGTDTTPLLLSLTCLFISTGFWMCDTTAYYYQRVNRQKILNLQTKISNRNTGESIAPPILPNSWNAAILTNPCCYTFTAQPFSYSSCSQPSSCILSSISPLASKMKIFISYTTRDKIITRDFLSILEFELSDLGISISIFFTITQKISKQEWQMSCSRQIFYAAEH